MIKLDLSVAVAIYVTISIVLIFTVWIFSKDAGLFKKKRDDKNYVWQCSICYHVYIDSRNASISKCPRCSSLNKR